MLKNFKQLWAEAGKKVLEAITDDNKWNLFVAQALNNEIDLNDFKNPREMGKDLRNFGAYLQSLYFNYSMQQICDSCDYCPNQRRGEKRFAQRRRFDCSWTKTQGNVLAEQTARKEGQKFGASYNFNDSKWKARYQKLSQRVLEEHKDRTKAPPWLDAKRNLCPNYYIDLSRA